MSVYKNEASKKVWIVPTPGDPESFLDTEFSERAPVFAPDGQWIAYVSDETGRDEIYVTSYLGPGARHLISTGGGREPAWSRDGRELFYRNEDVMMVVSIDASGGAFTARKPKDALRRFLRCGHDRPGQYKL